MKNKELARTLKFILFSASAGILQALTFTALTELTSLQWESRNLIALVVSVLWNFTINRRFTFQSSANVPKSMLLVALFYCVFTPLSVKGGGYLNDVLIAKAGLGEELADYIVQGITMACNLVTEYLYDTYVVYRGKMDTNDIAKKKAAKEAAAEAAKITADEISPKEAVEMKKARIAEIVAEVQQKKAAEEAKAMAEKIE